MSFEAMTWATKHRGFKSTAPRMVLLMLADEADSDGVSFIGQEKLAWKCEITARSLRTQLKELEARGLIHRERRSAEWVQGGRKVDAIVLHLEVSGSQERYPGAAQAGRDREENRRRFEVPFEAEGPERSVRVSPSQDQPETISGSSPVDNVSPSQDQPETISGRGGNRKIRAFEPENSCHSATGAFKGSRVRINPLSIPSEREGQAVEVEPVVAPVDGRMDGPMDDSHRVEVEDHAAPAGTVVAGVDLNRLRAKVGGHVTGVSDAVLGEIVQIVLGRAHGPVRSPMGLAITAIKADATELVLAAEDRLGWGQPHDASDWDAWTQQAQEPATGQTSELAPGGTARVNEGVRERSCPTHQVSFVGLCPCCAADAKSAPIQAGVDPETAARGRELLAEIRGKRSRGK